MKPGADASLSRLESQKHHSSRGTAFRDLNDVADYLDGSKLCRTSSFAQRELYQGSPGPNLDGRELLRHGVCNILLLLPPLLARITNSACASMPLYDSTIRIPPELFEAYLRYKQDTRVVLDWLCHQDSASKSKDGRIFMDDLVVLASTLKTKGVRIPETIAFQFKEAIRGRRLLSAWFREQRRLQRGEENYDRLARMSDEDSTVGAVTESHEWFTDRSIAFPDLTGSSVADRI
jgi:hypothetical protein